MEPDHSASIPAFLKKYPKTTVVSTAKGFQFMEQFFPEFFAGQGLPAEQRIVAANDGVLELGQHSLHFVYATMVRLPQMALANSVRWMQRKNGRTKPAATISVLSENMVPRYRLF